MRKKHLALIIGTSVAVLAFCGTIGRTIWPPMSEASLCGTFESSQGGVIDIKPDGTFTVSNATFGHNPEGGVERISGSGILQLEHSVTANAEIVLRMKDAKVALELESQRSWRGEVSLWHYIEDPDSGERETFMKKSGC